MDYIPALSDAFLIKTKLAGSKFYLDGQLIAGTLLEDDEKSLLSLSEYASYLRYIRLTTTAQIIADGQSGFGNPMNTYYTVQELERSGANAILLGDQTYPMNLANLEVTSDLDFFGKIQASLDARENPATTIMAQLDGISIYGVQGLQDRIDTLHRLGIQQIALGALQQATAKQLTLIFAHNPDLGLLLQPEGIVPEMAASLTPAFIIDTQVTLKARASYQAKLGQFMQTQQAGLTKEVAHESR